MSETYTDVEEAWDEIFETVDEKELDVSEEDVRDEVKAVRREGRAPG